MANEAPSWADQWGAGGFGAGDDAEMPNTQKGSGNGGNSKLANVKAAASTGLGKAKAAAALGAGKVKTGTSVGFNWVKAKYQKKGSSSSSNV